MTAKSLIRFTLLCALASVLTACMSLPRSPLQEARNQTLSWEARQQQLQAINAWRISGAIAVKNDQQGGQLRFHWQQQQDHYDVDLTAPLGGMIAKIQGKPGNVTIEKPNELPKHAADPEHLLAQELGWTFPVNYIQYWIRGLPAPDAQAQTTFDAYQHIHTLQQGGWHVEYARYADVKGVDVPAKIIVSRSPLLIRMVVTSWT